VAVTLTKNGGDVMSDLGSEEDSTDIHHVYLSGFNLMGMNLTISLANLIWPEENSIKVSWFERKQLRIYCTNSEYDKY